MNNSIQSAIWRLTAWYVGIIMLLSIGFSIFLYQIYRVELSASLPAPSGLRQQLLYDGPRAFYDTFQALREQRIADGLLHIQQNLLLLNVAMLVVGGAVSYFLARRNLQPVAEALDAQSRFTADASHELRTPLTVMRTEIEVALRNPSLTKDEAKSLLKSNLEEVAKLKSLAEGLLKLAQANAPDIPMTTVSLQLVVAEAVERLQTLAEAKNMTIANTVGAVQVRGDKHSLIELVTILLDNAIKYSKPGTTITLAAQHHGKQVHLSVTDQGHGIKASDLPHIFDRFYRADTSRSKEKTDGYGLGLPIARQIVEAHQGTIEARSTLGKGSTFTVKLPGSTPVEPDKIK